MHKTIKISLHIIFWLVYCLFAAQMSFDLQHGFGQIFAMFREFVLLFIWAAVAFYTMYFFGYKYFEKGKYLVYALYCLVVALLNTSVFSTLIILFQTAGTIQVSLGIILPSFFGTIILANCGSLLRGFVNWMELVNERSELEKRSLQHELESLRSQMNPHFLFNTINNIDSLILTAPQKASEALLKLSEILRYMLYDAHQKTVFLTSEVEHIEKLIALQQLRFTNPDYIRFIISGEYENSYISPLLFTPFIENAFKYAYNAGKMPVIEIEIFSGENKILFKCKNSYNPEKATHSKDIGGIGLKNVKRRLELLYPHSHTLQITDKSNTFEVNLSIETSSK